MKKLTRSEVTVVAKQIGSQLFENELKKFRSLLSSNVFQLNYMKAVKKSKAFKFVNALNKSQKDFLLSMGDDPERLIKAYDKFCEDPTFEYELPNHVYRAYSKYQSIGEYYENTLLTNQEIHKLFEYSGIKVKNFKRADSGSLEFEEIKDAVTLAQIQCKDLDTLISNIVKQFSK